MPTTKAYHRFKERCDYYETDLQLCDRLVEGFFHIANSNQPLAVAFGSTVQAHPKLRQKNTQMTRNIRGGHLRNTLQASFVKDLYEDFVEFLSDTMIRAAQKGVNPGRFAGDAKIDLQATEILKAANWENLVTLVSQKIFRSIENERKTVSLISKISNKLGLNIVQPLIDAAMLYLDARHILVHQDGRADEIYRRKYPSVGIKSGKIRIDSAFISAARTAVDALAQEIDRQVIANDLVKPEHLHTG